MSSSPPPVQYHGLLNQGETCYLNSVLQVLFMTKDFRAAVERHCCEYPATECIDRQLKDLFDDLKGNTAYTYNITKKLGIDRVYEQQDAAEYYEKILSLTSPDASQMFHGWLTDRTTCFACGTETDTDGAFWHLPLALVDSYSEHYSVVDGIKEHFKASEFSGENQMYCEKCDAKCDATIQCVMKHHPEVLMLLLKRFDFDYRYMTYVKINQTVDVPRILQIPENQTYELYAVVNHSGDLSSGCYSATIWDDENWFTFTDSRVTLADYQPFQEDNFEKSCSAYLLFYRKQNATQTSRAVSAPGGYLPPTGDDYEQCKDAAKKRGKEEGEAIDRDEETKSVRSRGVELHSDPRDYENDQDTIPRIHQVCNGERNDKNHLQGTQAEEHRDEAEILTRDKEGKGGNAEAENQAEEMERLYRVTQCEESFNDQGSGKESAPDVSNDLKPEISDMLAKDAHLRKEVERSDEETGVMDVKTGEDKQSEKEGKSLTKYPEDNARENVDENLRGTQEVRQDYDLKPVGEDEQRDERGGRTDDEEEKTEAGERGIASEIGKLNHDYGRDGGSKQNMPNMHPEQKIRIMPTIQEDVELDKKGKTGVNDRGMGSRPTKLLTKYDLLYSLEIQDYRGVDYNKQKMPKEDQRCKEGGSSRHEGQEQERGVRRDVKGVTERNRGDSENPHFGQDVEDQSFVGLDDRQRMSEQKISGTYPSRKDDGAETLSKHIQNRSDSSLRRAGSAGSSKPAECQEAGCGEQVRRNNPQPKPTLEFPESTREERPCSKDVVIKITDTEIRSGTVARSSVFSNLGQAGSVGSSKPAECQEAGCGEQVRRNNPQLKPTLEFPESTREERPCSKDVVIKITDTEIRSGTVARSSAFSDLRQAGSVGSSKPAECQGAGCGEQVRRNNPQPKPTLEFPESTREESPGSKDVEIKITDTEIRSETVAGTSSEGNLSKRFAKLEVSESSPTKPKKRANQKAVGNAQEEESRVPKKQKL